ncbi:ARM repeat-containing protein, partial [Hymenopellis radicata]
MPRENRKRGKKHKKPAAEPDVAEEEVSIEQPEEAEAGPSWIVQKPEHTVETDAEAPFGYLDADVKAYFRTVDVQMRQWQDGSADIEEDEKRAFFLAALTEMNEKEMQLATDPDCSIILERVVHSMDDFARRVFADRLAGSYEVLSKHRFASHVIQTLISVAGETVTRETKGKFPADSPPDLRTMTELLLDISDELIPSLSILLNDAFASHIVRALLSLLAGLPSTMPSNTQSKKSKQWKDRQGEMRNLFEAHDKIEKPVVPPSFGEKAATAIRMCRKSMSANEVRACAASKVACPGLDVLLVVEANTGLSNEPGSLMDSVTTGIVADILSGRPPPAEPSSYITTLLKDTTSSHLLETVLIHAPQPVFDALWANHLCRNGDSGKVAVHPVSNYVLARAVPRANETQLNNLGRSWWPKAVKAGRMGVVKAVVDRAAELKQGAEGLWASVKVAFGVGEDCKTEEAINCVLCLKTVEDFRATEEPEPNVQGALLLQSLLRLPDPHNSDLIEDILGLPLPSLKSLAQHPVSSRILDVLLDAESVPKKAKTRFVMAWLGHYHELVDDRIGSRVGERCWKWCDTYTKEKIARSVMDQEQALAASFYGKYFARGLNLYLLKKKPYEWRDFVTGQAHKTEVAKPVEKQESVVVKAETTSPKKKRKQEEDEIDVLFKKAKKSHKGALEGSEVVLQADIKPPP